MFSSIVGCSHQPFFLGDAYRIEYDDMDQISIDGQVVGDFQGKVVDM